SMQSMTASTEDIESRIAFLEQANGELSDLVYRQQQEIDNLRTQVATLAAQFAAAASEDTEYTGEQEERPPHY
ncbi:MAG: SlyX family protein, partial [Steroidobacteraceae bacterium]